MASHHYSHTNNTAQYQVVGNCSEVISSHVTEQEAVAALEAIPHVEETPYARIGVVGPNQTVQCELVSPELTAEQIAANEAYVWPWER